MTEVGTRPAYPPARRQPLVDLVHGLPVADPYRWLEDADLPETRWWLEAQQALADARVCQPSSRQAWGQRLAAADATGLMSPPVWRGNRYLVARRDPGQERAAVYLVEPDGRERCVLDPARLDPTGLSSLDRWQVSWDCRFVAYQVSTRGTEQGLLYVLDIETGQTVAGPIGRVRYAPVVWAPDSRGFWYVRQATGGSTTVGHRRLYFHQLGRDADHDEVVFGAGLPDTVGLWPRLFHRRWLTVRTTLGTSPENTLWLADLSACRPDRPVFHPVLAEPTATAMPAVGLDGQLYLRTTLAAARGRVCAVDLADLDRLGPAHWREVVAEQPDSVLRWLVPLSGGECGRQRLFVVHSRQGASWASVYEPGGGQLRQVRLPGAGSVSSPAIDPAGGRSVWFHYTDPATPTTVLRFDLDTYRTAVFAAPPGPVAAGSIAGRQVEFASLDGTPVPMFVFAPAAGTAGPDRPRPCLLTGYGGFGVSMTLRYSAEISAWLSAGGVVAVACVRGGGEQGSGWHRAGAGVNKVRAVEDFNAAAQWLTTHGWCGRGQLAALGSSNGGLLATAAMIRRPDLYRAVAAVAPLADMVRYELSGMGPMWRSEYGTVRDPAQFRALLDYSPYHQVRPQSSYPAVLLVVPQADTRVDPMHGRKLCAALQHATVATHPVLLRSWADRGHGAADRARSRLDTAEILAFLAEQTGLAQPS